MSHAIAYGPTMTVDEFLLWPGDGLHKWHALIDGVPVAMNPAALPHSLIQGEIVGLLHTHLRATRPQYRVMIEPGVQPRAGASNNVRVPDVAVACGPIGGKLLRNPLVLIEILSPSNAAETREAVRACLSIATVRDILVVDSLSVSAELLCRVEGGLWPDDPVRLGPGDEVVLDSIGFRSPLTAFYAGTALVPD